MTHTNKKKNRTKATVVLALALALALTATACSSSKGDEVPAPGPNSNTTTNTDTNNNETGTQEPNTAVPDNNQPEDNSSTNGQSETPEQSETPQAEPQNSSPTVAEGRFNGLADSHTVELETASGAEAFQFDEGLMDTLSNLDQGDKVRYVYTEKVIEGSSDKQLWINKIEKVE